MPTQQHQDEPIHVGTVHQLFLDDYLVQDREKLALRVNPVTKHPENPVIHPVADWEPTGYITYGSVIWDAEDRLYKAWCYGVGDLREGTIAGETANRALFYFTSLDGIHWDRPELDVVEIGGRRTNIVAITKNTDHSQAWPYCQEFFGVSKDTRDTDPARRYKMGYLYLIRDYAGDDGDPEHPGQQRGLGVAFSEDGIHWTPHDGWVTHATIDGSTFWMWDGARGKWAIYGRGRRIAPDVAEKWGHLEQFEHHWGRAVKRAESADFMHWEPDDGQLVMQIDTDDGPNHEIYGMSVFPYEDIYIGLVQMFYNYPEDVHLDIQLAVSRDGISFQRLSDRSPFIPVGGVGDWDRMNHSPANSPPIRVRDELHFYYGGRNYRHASPYSFADDGRKSSPEYLAGVGVGSVPTDRFAGLEASFDAGRLTTKPLILDGNTLHVNADVRFGVLEVKLLDVHSGPIEGVEAVIRGADAPDITLDIPGLGDYSGVPVRLQISLANGRLYSLWAELENGA